MEAKHNIEVTPLAPAIGAEVSGIDLGESLSDEVVNALERAWMKHLVLFFRDQTLSIEQLSAFGAQFGVLHIHPQGDMEHHPGVIKIHTDGNSKTYAGRGWHSDVSCDKEPPLGSILHLHTIPDSGGDTIFSNMYAAFEALSQPMKVLVSALRALHSGEQNYRDYFGNRPEELRDGCFPETIHPVVRTHPVTGRKALYVNEIFTHHIVDVEPAESDMLLEFLYAHARAPRFQCRFRWSTNAIAMWDNRCTQHMALWDYFPDIRSGYRVTVAGDTPA